MAGFFNKRIIKVEVAGQTIEIYPIPVGKLATAIKIAQNISTDTSKLDNIQEVVDQMCKIVKDNSNIPELSDVEELSISDIGFVFGKLVQESQDPKVSAPIGATTTM